MRKLRVLSLFAGIGGFDLGLEKAGGFSTVAFCEIDPFAQRVLKKNWPNVPCFSDVRKLKGSDIGPVDVICGGYPCQPFSTAGKRKGAQDDRHLWPEFMRIVAELRPAWVIGENVAGHISMGLDDVLADLEAEGYACRTFVIPACAIGASHRRDRVWTVAHRNGECWTPMRGKRQDAARESFGGRNDGSRSSSNAQRQISNGGAGENSGDVAHAKRDDAQGQQPCGASNQAAGGKGQANEPFDGGERRKRGAKPRMGGVVDGLSCWLDEPGERVKSGVKDRAARLKALGNAVHPDIPYMIGRAILAAEKETT